MNVLSGRALILSVAGFAAAALVFGSSLVDALQVGGADDSSDETAATTLEQPESRPVGRYSEAAAPEVSFESFMQAVEDDPFQPDRTAPVTRYLLPGERVERSIAVEVPDIEPPNLRVVGTGVIGRGGLALVQVEEGTPIAVGVGEWVQGYRVASVTAEGATLVGPAGRLQLSITDPAVARERGDDNDNRRSRDNDNARELERAQQRIQEMMQQLRGRANAGGRGGFPGRGGRGGGGGASEPS